MLPLSRMKQDFIIIALLQEQVPTSGEYHSRESDLSLCNSLSLAEAIYYYLIKTLGAVYLLRRLIRAYVD